ncbi:DUF2971 domain-containing protein [Vibrio mediterranei]|uniref:DUF2971 domain-containing protein n=1 Tax=Vibrio mediterranei TaxID=689 RepID=UPI001EFE8302|nr:DUF2971 domain-containing protein [Vibrio mediterranei]MCG9625907.1 DUF2971 domain-containing protein [Vibrio mediterranei]
MRSRFINYKQEDIDKYIYRVFSFERLLELFNQRELTLVHPSLWEDPFENFFLNSEFTNAAGRKFSLDLKYGVYGQCWSLSRESDAMWRIYSPDKRGVKVRTTSRNLLRYLNAATGDLGSAYIGKVNYLAKTKIKELCNDENFIDSSLDSEQGIASTLLYKRREFSHENEVRLIHTKTNSRKGSNKVFTFSVDPMELIDQIVFDPRINDDLFKVYKKYISDLGFKKGIIKSSLYNLPALKVEI